MLFQFGNQSIHIYLAMICARNFIMFWEYINMKNRLAVSLYFNVRKSQQIDVEGLYDALNILEKLESCRSSTAMPQGGCIFVLNFYCNSPLYPLIKLCWSHCNHLLTSVFVSILSPSVKLKVLVTQWCQTLCDPMDCSLPGSSVHGILQAWITEWVALPFSRGSSWPRDRTQVSHIAGRFFAFWVTREAGASTHHINCCQKLLSVFQEKINTIPFFETFCLSMASKSMQIP